jgi:hypothetical protein
MANSAGRRGSSRADVWLADPLAENAPQSPRAARVATTGGNGGREDGLRRDRGSRGKIHGILKGPQRIAALRGQDAHRRGGARFTPGAAAPNPSPSFRIDEAGLLVGLRSRLHIAVDYLDGVGK